MWVGATYTGDLGSLPGRQRGGWVQAPGAGQQALLAQQLMDAGYDALEVVGRVEEGLVDVQQIGADPVQLGAGAIVPSGSPVSEPSIRTAALVPIAHWPSSPPTKRSVTGPSGPGR